MDSAFIKYILRRLLFLIFLLFGVTLAVFIITHMVPANPAAAYLTPEAMSNPDVVAAFNARWGLDKPLPVQYFLYMKNLLSGDLGTSLRTKQPVLTDLMKYFPATVELSITAMLFAAFFGIIFGIISATHPNSPLDQVLRAVSVSGVSVPTFWLSLVFLYLFYFKWKLLPGPGRLSSSIVFEPKTNLLLLDSLLAGNLEVFSDAFSHLLLPGMVLGCFSMGLITRTTRSSLMDVLSMDYIRTARSKGRSRSAVVREHAMKNALVPVITVLGIGLCNLLGGVVLVEKIFSWPGVGQYAYLAATSLDFPAISGVALLIALIYVVVNLVIDIIYAAIDPRVRYY